MTVVFTAVYHLKQLP